MSEGPDQGLPHGIVCIDTELLRPAFAACYLLEHRGRAALIDTGPAPAVPKILEVLAVHGITPEQVDYILPTHVHLDHAGATGALLEHFENARVIVHPRGAKHLIEPSNLWEGAKQVYGEANLKTLFGAVKPVPAARLSEAPDGMQVDLNGRPLQLLDTPGHASHHLCVWDEYSGGLFTGDTFGLAYPELVTAKGPFLLPPTTPVQFKPQVWQQSLDRLADLFPARAYLTHFGMLEKPMLWLNDLRRRIDAMADIAYACEQAANPAAAIREQLWTYCFTELEGQGSDLPEAEVRRLLAADIELNAQGLEVWLARQRGG